MISFVNVFWPEAGYGDQENRVGSLNNYNFFKQQ